MSPLVSSLSVIVDVLLFSYRLSNRIGLNPGRSDMRLLTLLWKFYTVKFTVGPRSFHFTKTLAFFSLLTYVHTTHQTTTMALL